MNVVADVLLLENFTKYLPVLARGELKGEPRTFIPCHMHTVTPPRQKLDACPSEMTAI